jgi:Flp pilus assembly protein TadG
MKPGLKRRRGATLVEVGIVSGILILMVLGVVSLTITTTRELASNGARLASDHDAAMATQLLAREVRNGMSASVNSAGTELSVVLPYVNAAGDYDRFQQGETVLYYLSSGRLYRRSGSAAAVALAEGITSLRFTLNGSQVGVQLTTRGQSGNRSSNTTLGTQVMLRNEPHS